MKTWEPQALSSEYKEKQMQKGVETKMPLPLFESVEQTPFKRSFFLDTSLLVAASSADSMRLLKRVDESPLKTISV